MLQNFHLAVIIDQDDEIKLQRILLDRSSQNTLAQQWSVQYTTFISQEEEIVFKTAYTLGEGECFAICPYLLPNWCEDYNSEDIITMERFHINESIDGSIKAIVALAQDNERKELMLFQHFNPSQAIRRGRMLIFQNDTYTTGNNSILTISDKLTAVYLPDDKKLLFYSFHNVKKILPLLDVYYTASNQDIHDILSHELLYCTDQEIVVENANQYMRRRFAILKESRVLDNFSVKHIQQRANEHELSIGLHDDKIIFPTNKEDAKSLLKFLNEEIFQGALTNNLYETNSKKEVNP